MNRRDIHKRADDAVTFGQHIAAIAALALAILALGYLALLGDDIRAARMGITVEELYLPPHEYVVDHQRIDARCSWSCINRFESQGETWSNEGANQ